MVMPNLASLSPSPCGPVGDQPSQTWIIKCHTPSKTTYTCY